MVNGIEFVVSCEEALKLGKTVFLDGISHMGWDKSEAGIHGASMPDTLSIKLDTLGFYCVLSLPSSTVVIF